MRLCNRLHDECNPPNRNELGIKRGHLRCVPERAFARAFLCRRRDLATLIKVARHRGHDLRSRTPRRRLHGHRIASAEPADCRLTPDGAGC